MAGAPRSGGTGQADAGSASEEEPPRHVRYSQVRIGGEVFARHSPRPRVAGGGFANESLGHCGHAEVNVQDDVAEKLLLAEVRARHLGMLPALVEAGPLVTGAAEHDPLPAQQQPPPLVAGSDSVRRRRPPAGSPEDPGSVRDPRLHLRPEWGAVPGGFRDLRLATLQHRARRGQGAGQGRIMTGAGV